MCQAAVLPTGTLVGSPRAAETRKASWRRPCAAGSQGQMVGGPTGTSAGHKRGSLSPSEKMNLASAGVAYCPAFPLPLLRCHLAPRPTPAPHSSPYWSATP